MTIEPSFALAQQHVAALTGAPGSRVCLQTFTERDKPALDRLAIVMHGTLDELWPRVVRLQAQGAGVFITANETDGRGRGDHQITVLRAIWADMDEQTQEPPAFPLKPHIVLETSPGKWHCVWRTNAPDKAAHAAVLRHFVHEYGADANATGASRVLRLAGTLHLKTSQPHLVRIRALLQRRPYDWDEVVEQFPPVVSSSKAEAGGERTDDIDLIRALKSGRPGMHDAMVKFTARLAARGFDRAATVEIARDVIASGEGAERWNAAGRDGDLVRAAEGAFNKWQGFTDSSGEAVCPIDLFAVVPESPRFDASLFPDLIGALAVDCGRRMGCDPLIPAFTALVACAALIPDSFKLQVKANDGDWRESARLWCAFVGDPSSKKSPAMSTVLKPVYDLQSRLMIEHRVREQKWKRDVIVARDSKQPAPEVPKSVRVMVGDTTTEALVNLLENNHDGLLVVHDELAGLFGSMDAYRPSGAAKDRPFYLGSFNGQPFTVDRVGTGERFIPNVSLCMVGGIQPDLMRKYASTSIDDGLLQRFIPLTVAPSSDGEDVAVDQGASNGWAALVDELFQQRGGSVWPCAYRLDAEAQRIVDSARRRIHALMKSPGTDKRLASALGKGEAQLARLILTYHLIENRSGEDLFDGVNVPISRVPPETAAKAACLFFNLIVPAMHHFYATVIGLSATHEHARWIAGYILAKALEEISERAIYRAYNALRDEGRRDIAPAMLQLQLAGWVSPLGDGRGMTTKWRVNPDVHLRFAEVALVERERRARERDAIQRAVKLAA